MPLLIALAAVAFLYASVGHAGASGYIAVLALAGVPAALVGGAITLPAVLLRQLIGAVLLFSAWRLVGQLPADPGGMRVPGRRVVALTGGTLGLLAGLTGTGGGIFLTPWMILRSWLLPKQAAAVSVAFILVNSIAGLAGLLLRQGPTALPDPVALDPPSAGGGTGDRRLETAGRLILSRVLSRSPGPGSGGAATATRRPAPPAPAPRSTARSPRPGPGGS